MTLTVPLKLLAPERESVPLPCLTRLSVLLEPESLMAPAKLVLELSPSVRVRETEEPLRSTMLPEAPAREPKVALEETRSRVAPLLMVTAVAEDRALSTPYLSVPAPMVVEPVWLVAALRTMLPVPDPVVPN